MDPAAPEANSEPRLAGNDIERPPTINLEPGEIDSSESGTHGIEQAWFRDNQFSQSSLLGGSEALVTQDCSLSHRILGNHSGSGSEADPQESNANTKTIKTVNDLGLDELDEPLPIISHDGSTGRELALNPPGPHDDTLSAVEGVGSGFPLRPLLSGSITNEINKSMQRSAFSGEDFLPVNKLEEIISRNNVYHLFQNIRPNDSPGMVESNVAEILKPGESSLRGRRRILAILIRMEEVEYIFDFIDKNVYDCDLPLTGTWNSTENKYDIAKAFDSTPVQCCARWADKHWRSFESQQMAMFAPIFHESQQHTLPKYELRDNTILPFLENTLHTSGGYGKVYKVKIHPAHVAIRSKMSDAENSPYVAVKALHTSEQTKLKEEVEVFNKIRRVESPSPHLIQLLLTYKRNDNYYLMFHWAKSNLKQYWKAEPDRPHTPETYQWFMKQCIGIVSGLQQIHKTKVHGPDSLSPRSDKKVYGRHGDIKPENILCFERDGDVHLVITDFGLTRYHSNESVGVSKDVRGFSTTYRPPECDSTTSPITQRYDMWTLGCLLLEFISWLVLGNEATEDEFARERAKDDDSPIGIYEDKFFNYNHEKEAQVKDSVSKWIFKIGGSKRSPPFINKMLDLVQSGLLVPDAERRLVCEKVCEELDRIQASLNEYLSSESEVNYSPPPCSNRGSTGFQDPSRTNQSEKDHYASPAPLQNSPVKPSFGTENIGSDDYDSATVGGISTPVNATSNRASGDSPRAMVNVAGSVTDLHRLLGVISKGPPSTPQDNPTVPTKAASTTQPPSPTECAAPADGTNSPDRPHVEEQRSIGENANGMLAHITIPKLGNPAGCSLDSEPIPQLVERQEPLEDKASRGNLKDRLRQLLCCG